MSPGRLPRRKRLALVWLLASLAALSAVLAVFYYARRQERPYRAGETVEGIVDSLGREIPEDYPKVKFIDATAGSGIAFRHFAGVRSTQLPEDMGSGAAWGDYDGDGDLDLYLCAIDPASAPEFQAAESGGSAPPGVSNRLYQNNGDGTFSDVSEEAGVNYRGISNAAAWADYDGDGDLDLAVTAYGPILLYRNRGDGSFEEVGSRAGMDGFTGFWTGASWGDYDGDGDLDLYVCGYVQYRFKAGDTQKTTRQYSGVVPFTLNPSSYPPESNLLFRNDGGKFTEVARPAGVDNPAGRSLSAAWCDFNLDGKLDLYVANDVSDNALFENKGDGTFADVSHFVWAADYRGAMGLGVGDWDNDGDFDIFITHWIAQENALFTNLLHAFDKPGAKADKLLFMDVADQNGLGQIALDFIGWGASFLDYDNDGRTDLLAVNGSTFQQPEDPTRLVPMRSLLFWNRGPEDGFFEVGAVSGEVFQQAHVGRGAAFADYDEDGDVDVVVVNHGEGAMLLRNEGGNRNHWLRVQVTASGKNRHGLGAIVQVSAGGVTQTQQIGSQASYLSQNATLAYFGLGGAESAERVAVTLLDGRRQVLENVPANRPLSVQFP